MVILHGWINSRRESKELIDVFNWLENHEGFVINKVNMNGEVVWNIFSCRNGYSLSIDSLYSRLQEALVKESPDTYGLLYLINDEDSEKHDTWQVWKIYQNKIAKDSDSYLSPYSEKVAWHPDEDC